MSDQSPPKWSSRIAKWVWGALAIFVLFFSIAAFCSQFWKTVVLTVLHDFLFLVWDNPYWLGAFALVTYCITVAIEAGIEDVLLRAFVKKKFALLMTPSIYIPTGVVFMYLIAQMLFIVPQRLYCSRDDQAEKLERMFKSESNKVTSLESEKLALLKSRDELRDALLLLKTQPSDPSSTALTQASNLFTRTAIQMADSVRKQERLVVEAAKGSDEVLKAIAARPIAAPTIDLQAGKIDLGAIGAVGAVLEETQTKKAAQEALVRRENAPRDAATLKAAAPLVDYYLGTFEDALRNLAKENGDNVVSTYTNAVELALRGAGKDVEGIRLQKHTPWAFDVCFRQVDGNGNYNWHIRGAVEFMCFFKGEAFSYLVTDTDIKGEGQISSLGKTNFLPALTWLIGIQNKHYPLTNSATNPK